MICLDLKHQYQEIYEMMFSNKISMIFSNTNSKTDLTFYNLQEHVTKADPYRDVTHRYTAEIDNRDISPFI